MRNGKLMAEDTPDRLLQMYNCNSLEDVFLRLSSHQEGKGILPVSNTEPISIVLENVRTILKNLGYYKMFVLKVKNTEIISE